MLMRVSLVPSSPLHAKDPPSYFADFSLLPSAMRRMQGSLFSSMKVSNANHVCSFQVSNLIPSFHRSIPSFDVSFNLTGTCYRVAQHICGICWRSRYNDYPPLRCNKGTFIQNIILHDPHPLCRPKSKSVQKIDIRDSFVL
jgi:hypothetical protein